MKKLAVLLLFAAATRAAGAPPAAPPSPLRSLFVTDASGMRPAPDVVVLNLDTLP